MRSGSPAVRIFNAVAVASYLYRYQSIHGPLIQQIAKGSWKRRVKSYV
jgi:hypothetical protein